MKTGPPFSNKTEIFRVLGLAVRDGYEEVALALLDKCVLGHGSEDTSFSNGGSDNNVVEPASKLLVFAAGAGCSRIVRELLAKHGPDINAVYTYRGEDGCCVEQSPLMTASRRGDTSVVRLLLDTDWIRPGLSADYGVTSLTLPA